MNAILKKQNTLMDRFVKAAALKFETGETGSLEKVTAMARQQELQQQLKQNEASLKVEKSRMNVLLNRPTDFVVADTSFTALPLLAVLDTNSIKQNANVLLALQEVKVAEANSKVEQSSLWPDLSASYFIQSLTGNQDVDGQSRYYDGSLRFQGFSVGISLPIFAGSNVSRIKASKTNVALQQKNADYLQQQLKSEYQQQSAQLDTYQSLLDYYTATALPNADIITNNATKAYLNGDIAYVEYVQALETALNIRLNHVNAINKFNETVINLQFLSNQ
jgi:cobalt-zinc-cadmium resistance protein CzcA